MRSIARCAILRFATSSDEPIFTFHSGIPLPPKLAILSLKRFWTGDMTNARLVSELEAARPEILLLGNDSRPRPFQDLLDRDYRLVYEEATHRLYVLKLLAAARPY